MSVAKLGSYANLLAGLHQYVGQLVAPLAPRPSQPVPSPLGRDSFVSSVKLDPNSFFISQVRDARWNPNAVAGNTNCGPTSLAMALRGLGLMPPGLTQPSNPEDWIDKTRRAMEGDENDFKLTSDDDIVKGALAAGAKAQEVHSLPEIEQALQQGQYVVLAGDPVAYERRLSSAQYQNFDGGHFVLVTGKVGDNFQISDPLSHVGNFTVTRAELAAYMGFQSWNTGVAIGR